MSIHLDKDMDVHLGYVRDLLNVMIVVDSLDRPIDIASLHYQGEFKTSLENKNRLIGSWKLADALSTFLKAQ